MKVEVYQDRIYVILCEDERIDISKIRLKKTEAVVVAVNFKEEVKEVAYVYENNYNGDVCRCAGFEIADGKVVWKMDMCPAVNHERIMNRVSEVLMERDDVKKLFQRLEEARTKIFGGAAPQ